jgi:hypothetical protein
VLFDSPALPYIWEAPLCFYTCCPWGQKFGSVCTSKKPPSPQTAKLLATNDGSQYTKIRVF